MKRILLLLLLGVIVLLNLAAKTAPTVGVSIGTVDAQPYATSGLDLDWSSYIGYVAKTSDDTYLGFRLQSRRVDNEYVSMMSLSAISTQGTSVTIPDSIRVNDERWAVEEVASLDYDSDQIENLTLPATITTIQGYGNLPINLYMLGPAPQFYDNYYRGTFYVCESRYYSSYTSNQSYVNCPIKPYGWNFDEIPLITVHVEKNGEFAETYLTQNNYDWDAAMKLKVTGNINAVDLKAMRNLTAIMMLDLSETTITELSAGFMSGCRSLSEIKLPETLTSIGAQAFSGCTALTSFPLKGISEIEEEVFYNCKSLRTIDLTDVTTIKNSAFKRCVSLEKVDLSKIINIGSNAFCECVTLSSADVTSAIGIGGNAFNGCTALENIALGNDIVSIGNGAFSNTSLTSVVIPEGITSISYEIFEGCNKLTTIQLPPTITTIGSKAFENCRALTNVSLSTGLKTIGSNAFNGCTSLEEITLPATVNSIGGGAFYNTGIKTFRCLAVVPPTISDGSFIGGSMDMTQTYLYVPPFSRDFYRNTAYWSDFYLMRPIQDPIDYILVDRELSINLEEEDNAVVANNPRIDLTTSAIKNDSYYDRYVVVGQLTAQGAGTLSAGQLNITGQISNRNQKYQLCPTLINYADKMRADNVTHDISFYNGDYGNSGLWHFVSLPYDVKISDIVPGNETYWVIRRYDSAARAAGETSSTWVNMTNDDIMEAGKGYIISAAGGETYVNDYGGTSQRAPHLTFTSGNSLTKNNLFRPTDVVVSLTEYPAEFAHNRSWNLIGNPYPCYFDMHHLNEDFTAPITIWNGSAYVAYSPVDDDLVLAPYEAFFVQCPLETTQMTFKETGRMHATEGVSAYKAKSRKRTALSAEGRNVFDFTVTGTNGDDRTRIVLNPEAKAEYEIGRDASKFFAEGNGSAQLFVNADVTYSINERPVGDGSALLGFRGAEGEDYILSLSGKYNSEWHVMLTDNLIARTIDLTKEDYHFMGSVSEASDRFSVRFTLDGSGQSGIDSIRDDFTADAIVTVVDINGSTVFSGAMADMQVPQAGIYVVTDGNITRKAILK